MPWCPNCKTEYREGFEICSDCKSPLVLDLNDNLNETIIAKFNNIDICNKFEQYLSYSKIDFSTSTEDEMNILSVDEADAHKAFTALAAFVKVEKSLYMEKNIDSSYFVGSKEDAIDSLDEEFDDADDNFDSDEKQKKYDEMMNKGKATLAAASVYTSKRDKAEETYSSGIMFIVFGIAGIIFMILNMMHVVNLIAQGFSSIVMIGMFLAMFVGGIISCISSKKIHEDADDEDKFVEELKSFVKSSIRYEDIVKADNPEESDEFNYILRTRYIKEKITNVYGELDETFLDAFVEDYYNENFENN